MRGHREVTIFAVLRDMALHVVIAGIFATTLTVSSPAAAEALPPFKDRLFAYPGILAERDSGAYRVIDYREKRDINGRDQVPERRVKRAYVNLSVRRQQQDVTLETGMGPVSMTLVGNPDGASVVTMFIHGRGGDRRLGSNDHIFGGNFNRIKNLMVRAGGLYIVPDAHDFGADNARRIASALQSVLNRSPSAEIILACGSAGGDICYRLADDEDISARLAGIALLGSYPDAALLQSRAAARNVPVLIAHGSRDTVFAIETLEAFYNQIRAARIPVRMVRFETGTHGTPIRMIDWRETINWMIGQ